MRDKTIGDNRGLPKEESRSNLFRLDLHRLDKQDLNIKMVHLSNEGRKCIMVRNDGNNVNFKELVTNHHKVLLLYYCYYILYFHLL